MYGAPKETIDDSLVWLNEVTQLASPLCPYMRDSDVFSKLPGPQTQGETWVKERHAQSSAVRNAVIGEISRDAEVCALLGEEAETLPARPPSDPKARDHVAEIFAASAAVDESKKITQNQATYGYDSDMRKAMKSKSIAHYPRLRNENSVWAEQQAKNKKLFQAMQ